MKKLWILLVVGCYACHKVAPVPVVNEPDYKKGESFLDKQNDSAFYYFNKVVAGSKDSLQIAKAYNNMAVIQSDAGDYFGSQETLLASLKFLPPEKEQNHPCLASDYNELGLTSIKLKNYEAALAYFDQTTGYSTNKKLQLAILNNKALAYLEKGAYPQAIKIYQAVIVQTSRKQTYARILTNMARAKWLAQPTYNAAPELLKALAIRRQEKDEWGLNSSYIHLAEFYTVRRPDSSLFYATAMYTVARRINSPDDRLEALGQLIKVGSAQDSKQYFARYQHLSDSLQTARNAAKNQFALIRYNAEKNKADLLRSQYQLNKERAIQYGSIILFVMIIAATSYGFRKRKLRMAFEARQRELLLSQKVHDEVANGLYLIMKQIEHNDDPGREILLEDIKALYEQSRDISYEKPDAQTDFEEKIDKLLAGLAGAEIDVAIAGNNTALWEKVSALIKRQLLHVLQELMINMRKHSQATGITLSFKLAENQLHIQYTDNGKGFPGKIQFGNGLNNTVSRMERMGGTITFDPSAGKGAKILIALPI